MLNWAREAFGWNHWSCSDLSVCIRERGQKGAGGIAVTVSNRQGICRSTSMLWCPARRERVPVLVLVDGRLGVLRAYGGN
jgi:hypothetical protein